MIDNSICAEVEMNKLSLLRPTLLLRYDKIKIDKQDYEDILGGKENGWRSILKNNLKFLYDIGAIEVSDFQDYLSKQEKINIRKSSQKIVDGLSKKEKQKLLLQTWSDYINYIRIKTYHLQGNEKDYREQTILLNNMVRHYESIKTGEWDTEVQDYILNSCFWKTTASSLLSRKTNSNGLHLANEYLPFIEYVKPITGQERITQIDVLVKHIYSLALPSVQIHNFSERMAFIELRKNKFKEYKILCEQLNELLDHFEDSPNPLEDTKKYLTDRWSHGYETIQGFFSRMSNISLLPEYLIQILYKTFQIISGVPEIPLPSDLIKEASQEKIKAKPLNALKRSKVEWQVAFCTLFNEREIRRIKKSLRKDYSSTYESSTKNWIDNIGGLPWYVE